MDMNIPNTVVTTEKKIYTGTALKLLKLLGAGCTQVEASKACGVDESYTSQLMGEPSFVAQINEIVVKTMADQSVIDENYNEIEKNMSKRLLELSQYVFDPDKALRIAKFVNEANRKVTPSQAPGRNNGTDLGDNETRAPVTLILPIQVLNEFTLNPLGEVVGVNGKELVTLPSKNIDALVSKHKEKVKQLPVKFKNGPRNTDPYSDL